MIVKAETPIEHYLERMNDGFYKHFLDFYDENGKPFQVILHHFTKPDEGDLAHDHPFRITSQVISGSYIEETYEIGEGRECDGLVCTSREERKAGTTNTIEAGTIHKITELPSGECWTIARYGPEEKKSGFYKLEGETIKHRFWDEENWKEYVSHNNEIG